MKTFKYRVDHLEIKNGSRLIPAIITYPKGQGPFPAVVMNHGHGGSKEEHGGFSSIALELAERGILSIRMDFPGCGESKESFTENYLSNMISDSNASLNYILDNCQIDKDKLGILGYSMGGRIATTIGSDLNSKYKAMALLAPSVNPGEDVMKGFMGGEDIYNKLKDEAMSPKGYADFTNVFGDVQTLSHNWFSEMKASRPLATISNFKGEMLVIYGGQDFVVPPKENEALLLAFPKAKGIRLEDADHGYGFFGNTPLVVGEVYGAFGDFFADSLSVNPTK